MTPADLALAATLIALLLAVALAVWVAPGVKHAPQDRYPRRDR